MGLSEPIPIGYFAKRVVGPPDWLRALGVEEIGSVSECLAPGPPDWIDAWTHHAWGLFPTVAAARAVVPEAEADEYRLYAYLLLPVRFAEGVEHPLGEALPEVEAPDTSYERLGYDVVSRSAGTHFECSPLSCNHLAREVETNAACLLSDLERARRLARAAEDHRCEPGPYYVVEVRRAP